MRILINASRGVVKIGLIVAFGWALAAATAGASEPAHVVFHINEPAKLAMLTRSVESFRRIAPDSLVAVVFNGPAVVRLSSDAEYTDTVTQLLRSASWVGACSHALLQGRIEPSQLIPGVEVIEETGVKALIDLQALGYAYIKI